ncbi:MAG TPA: sugar ABC transporter permease [Chloroflexi bacterium]|nr:sugar ABC transporter permease [Chloroflexota bacterium]
MRPYRVLIAGQGRSAARSRFALREPVRMFDWIKSLKRRIDFASLFVFLFPLLLFLTILYGMLGWTFYVSFANWSGTAPNYEFAGLKWYRLMVSLDRFWVDMANNLKWMILGVIPTVVIALFLAYLLEIGSIKGIESYVRTLILYPVAMSFVVTGTIWSWMYQPDKGVFNTILRSIGLESLTSSFFTNPSTATYWLILIFIWQYLGFAVIILQSSFRTTELQEMIEAATVDGASRLRILFDIIVPNIRGGILILISLLLISALKVFDIVYIVTFGGPGYSTDVLAFFMFIATFQQHLVALGAGLGVIIFLLAFIIVIPYTIYAFRKWFE